jgi:hypothetical protein
VDYVAGYKDQVHDDLVSAGFERIGDSMWRKGDRRIRWVSGIERLRGIDGAGRKFIWRAGAEHSIEREAAIQRFEVVYSF